MEVNQILTTYIPETYLFCYASSNIDYLSRTLNINQPILYINAFVKNYVRIFAGNSKKWKGGIATIYPNSSSKVYGILLVLTNEQLTLLDNKQQGYKRQIITATIEGFNNPNTDIKCFTYIKENILFTHMPSNEYLEQIDLMLRNRIGYKGNNILIHGIVKNKIQLISVWNGKRGFKMKL